MDADVEDRGDELQSVEGVEGVVVADVESQGHPAVEAHVKTAAGIDPEAITGLVDVVVEEEVVELHIAAVPADPGGQPHAEAPRRHEIDSSSAGEGIDVQRIVEDD